MSESLFEQQVSKLASLVLVWAGKLEFDHDVVERTTPIAAYHCEDCDAIDCYGFEDYSEPEVCRASADETLLSSYSVERELKEELREVLGNIIKAVTANAT